LTIFHHYNKYLWFFGCPICYFEGNTDRQTLEDRQINGRMDGWMDRWKDEVGIGLGRCVCVCVYIHTKHT